MSTPAIADIFSASIEIDGVNISDLIGFDFLLTGSRYVCDPPVMDTDIDIVIVWSLETDIKLREAGFASSEDDPSVVYNNSSVVNCYRRDQFNILATYQEKYYLWKKYNDVATALNLREKEQRVALAQIITEGRQRETGVSLNVQPDEEPSF